MAAAAIAYLESTHSLWRFLTVSSNDFYVSDPSDIEVQQIPSYVFLMLLFLLPLGDQNEFNAIINVFACP